MTPQPMLVHYFAAGMAVRCFQTYKSGFKPHYRYCSYWPS